MDVIRGKQYYIIGYDKDGNIFCWYYDMNGIGKQMIDMYCKHNCFENTTIHVKRKFLSDSSIEVENMLHKKICILDKKVVTYDVIVQLAKTRKVVGYTEGKLKKNLNQFRTMKYMNNI
jgi:hypothetical protein